jgi:hypothetical protein
MSTDQAKKMATQFINDQKQILEAHGDKVVQSKYKDAIAGAQRTFAAISSASVGLAAQAKTKQS